MHWTNKTLKKQHAASRSTQHGNYDQILVPPLVTPPLAGLTRDRQLYRWIHSCPSIPHRASITAWIRCLQATQLKERLFEHSASLSQVLLVHGNKRRVGDDLTVSAPSDVYIRLSIAHTDKNSCLSSIDRSVVRNDCKLKSSTWVKEVEERRLLECCLNLSQTHWGVLQL